MKSTIWGVLLLNWISLSSAFSQDLLPVQYECIFSGTKDTESAPQQVTIRNEGSRNRVIRNVHIIGIDADAFRLVNEPDLPIRLSPNESVSFPVLFSPGGEAGFMNATLQINGANPKRNANVKLYGLSADGLEGENEPPLHYVVLTLGYAVEVGSASLKLGTTEELIGEEIASPRFVKSGGGKVTITPVARYSPAEPVPFGYYTTEADSPKRTEVGVLSGEPLQHQTLYPVLASGNKDFDPGDTPFGLFTQTKARKTYTEDKLNTGVKHAVRVYPLRDRRGQEIDNKFLVCFEEATNGDYQDFVFVISNVKPAFLIE